MTKKQLSKLLTMWKRGQISKTQIEQTYLSNTTAKGALITRLWTQRLGVDTRYGKVASV